MPQPAPEEIQIQLDLILESPEFVSSDRLKSFLMYVVEETLAGRGERIKAYNLAVDVFDLGLNFNSSLNPSVRVAASRLRNKLEHYYFTSSNSDTVLISIPKGSYLPQFSYFEPKHRRALQTDLPQNAASEITAKAENAIPAACDARFESNPLVIVVPFTCIGKHEHLQNFLLGLTEEIAIALTRFDELSVINLQVGSPESPESNAPDIWELSKKTGARFILGGSAQVGGKKNSDLRLRIHLSDAITRSQIWADRYDGTLDNASLFSLQDAITEQAAARIGDSFGLINRMLLKEKAEKSTADLKVYEAMLYYHHWLVSLTPERFIAAKNALERAIELDPAYATTKAMLADVYASHCQWSLNVFDDALELSLDLANQAIELDINCQYAHWAKAYNCYLRRDEKYFLDSVYRAIELNSSNTNILATAGKKLAMIGRSEEGLEMLSKALCLNPFIPSWYRSAPFIVHYMHQEYEMALAEAKHISTPNFMWGPLMRAAAHGMLGQKAEARAELTELLAIKPDFKHTGEAAMLLLFFQPAAVEKLCLGLKKAGL